MNRILSGAIIIALISSCTMIPKYSRPKSPVAETFSGIDSAEQIQAVSSIKWQEFFKSADLQKIIQTALDNNRDLRVAVLNIDAARALYRVSQSNLMPKIDAKASYTKQEIPANIGFVGFQNSRYDANIASAAFEIDLFGKIRSSNKMALESFFATTEAKNAAQIALIAEVANAYLQFLADQKIWQLAKDTVAAEEKSFEMIKKRFEFGIISGLDLSGARINIENAKSTQALYARKTEQDKNALLLLMGVASFELLEKPAKLEDVELMANLPIGLKSDVLLMRPDVMQAEHQLKAANANIGVARAAFFPTISLVGSAGYASSDLSNLFSSSSAAWSFTPQVSLPIFQGGKNKANLNYAKISKNIYIAKYEKAIQTAFREVADQLAAQKNLDQQMQAETNLADAANQAYTISNARYREGIDSFLNVADAQKQLFLAEQSKINLQKEKLANLTQLYKVLGGGIL
ncbi:MAG: efflux transporter outer membrane subunit [Pseudomonadota bacterium]